MGRHRFKCTSTDTVEEGVVFDGHFRMMKSHEAGFRDAAVIAPRR